MRVLVLGAGFGGLELAASLSETRGNQIDVTLIDQSDHFTFGYSKLDIMFGKQRTEDTRLPYSAISMPEVTFRQETITSIDAGRKSVTTDAGTHEADVLVIALGADYDFAATPGLVEYGREFYSVAGAERARDALAKFSGGKIVVAVTTPHFKCPPAPSECALLTHDYLSERGIRDQSSITLVMPGGSPLPVSEEVGSAILAELSQRNIGFRGNTKIAALESGSVRFADGDAVEADLVLAIPVHVAPQVVIDSGLTENGWIATDKYTLKTRWPDVYALGDVASVGVPRAGVFSEGQARIVAQQIIAQARAQGAVDRYDGSGRCYLELGGGKVGTVNVNFLGGPTVTAVLGPPTLESRADKVQFGATRRARWFGIHATDA